MELWALECDQTLVLIWHRRHQQTTFTFTFTYRVRRIELRSASGDDGGWLIDICSSANVQHFFSYLCELCELCGDDGIDSAVNAIESDISQHELARILYRYRYGTRL